MMLKRGLLGRLRTPQVTAIALMTLTLGACGGDGGSSPFSMPPSSSGNGTGSGSTTYSVGGSISGLTAAGLVLTDSTMTTSPSAGATSFTFSTKVATGTTYSISVSTQPSGQTCIVANGSGTVGAANVTNIAVTCSANGFTVGGSVAGLTGTGFLMGGGAAGAASVQAQATSFTFPNRLASGASYVISVTTQPSGQDCQITNGAGVIGSSNVTGVEAGCVSGQWTWVSGSNIAGVSSVYGTQGTGASTNSPGARNYAMRWTDASGNLWLFGGESTSGTSLSEFNDLWKYSPATGQWTWVGGSNTSGTSGVYGTQGTPAGANIPGARGESASWTDASGNLWLFGGYGIDSAGHQGDLNDLWQYSPTTGQWTWVSGSNTVNAAGVYGTLGTAAAANVPGARGDSTAWIDTSGNLWLFGGIPSGSAVQAFNDLWEYSPTSKQWTWMGGSNATGASGVYGTRGTPAATNIPGARDGAIAWTDSSGKFWLFGGMGNDSTGHNGALNDLWKYDPTTQLWAWIGGSSITGASGVYGVLGVAAAANIPGPRLNGVSWTDTAGNLWLFGGVPPYYNDVWSYSPSSGLWTWMGGLPGGAANAGVYGTLGTSSATNIPGSRYGSASWSVSGHLWLFGGGGYDSAGTNGDLNDLWEYVP